MPVMITTAFLRVATEHVTSDVFFYYTDMQFVFVETFANYLRSFRRLPNRRQGKAPILSRALWPNSKVNGLRPMRALLSSPAARSATWLPTTQMLPSERSRENKR